MTTEVLLALGEFRFSVNTAAYDQFIRTTAYRWPVQERIGRRPARQWLGIGDDTISLAGTILPTYAGGIGQIDRMREMAETGLPLMLSDGRGRIHGKWCILKIDQTDSVFFADGTPRKIEFKLELGHYGADD